MNHFINKGFGWSCRSCQGEDESSTESRLARFMREGEAEERLSSTALARWADETRTKLRCPRCGVEECLDSGAA